MRRQLDFMRAVAMGIVPGWDWINRFGRNTDVDSTSNVREDIWNGGGLYTGMPVGDPAVISEPLRITSTSAQDGPGGTGMRSVTLYGLGSDGLIQTEDVTLNGTTPVVTTKSWYRMNQLLGLSSGSNGGAVGTITTQHNVTTANIFSVLTPPQCCSHIAAYTIPAGREGLVVSADVTASNAQLSAQEITGAVAIRPYGGMFTHRFSTIISTQSPLQILTYGGLRLPPLTDISIRSTFATADNLSVTAKFEVMLYPEGIDF